MRTFLSCLLLCLAAAAQAWQTPAVAAADGSLLAPAALPPGVAEEGQELPLILGRQLPLQSLSADPQQRLNDLDVDEALAEGLAEPRSENPVEPLPDTQERPVTANSVSSTLFAPSFVRIEQDDAAWTTIGSWSSTNLGRASGGSHLRSSSEGNTAELDFAGTWISLGLIADRFSGEVEVSIDGLTQGSFDIYRREETPISLHFEGLAAGNHSIRLTVTGTANPLSASTRVQLDYADYGDGSLLPDGSFEEDDVRLLISGGWTSVAYADASGESYIRATTGSAWFPFAGDSFSLHALAYNNGGQAQLFVDGVYLDSIELFAPVGQNVAEPRVFSYQGLGAGHHVLQVLTYQYTTTIDRLDTPGSGPFIDPNPPLSGVSRFEADHPSIRYNGLPYSLTAATWTRVADINATRASAGEFIRSETAGDTVSFDFDGDWLGIGFASDRFGGQAEIAIDGVLQETIDLYTRFDDTASRYFRDLGPGPHSVTITVLGTRHPNSSNNRVHVDYFDVWDGQALAEGVFEEDDARMVYGRGWTRLLSSEASAGAYAASGSSANASVWFPFTGNSLTWQGRSRFSYAQMELRINGVSQGLLDQYRQNEGPISRSFDVPGPGPHIVELRSYRGETATLDVLITPAIVSPEPPPAALLRYEEDHPAMRYSGWPYRQMPQSWSEQSSVQNSSKYNLASSTAGDRWSLQFEGEWVSLGFRSDAASATAEVRIDGVSRGVIDTSGGVNGVRNFTYEKLGPGSHLVEVVVLSGTLRPDYIDVWNGQTVAAGWYDAQLEDEPSGLMSFSDRRWWNTGVDIYARNENFLTTFASTNTNLWFTFVGADLTVLGFERDNTLLQVVIDGVSYGPYDMSSVAPFRAQPRALHFPGLGAGPHSVQVALFTSGLSTARFDAFEVAPSDFASYMPQMQWYDTTAQETLPGASNTGFATSVAIGDLDGDGVVELVAPGLNGRLYVYRGDGQNAGNGTPIRWTSDLVGPAAEPALADLTGDGKAEIIVTGRNGTFAFRHDGQLLWSNTDVASHNSSEDFGWGGPSIANLDLGPDPEIVVAALNDALYVLDHQGNELWSDPLPGPSPTVPVLADITGDGVADIVVAQGWSLKVIDYLNGRQQVWRRDLPDPISVLGGGGSFGAPAIADLDGDGRPEIIINWGHVIEALQDDGSLLWRYPTGRTDLFRPSGVTVADVTGDGQPNIVTASAISSGFLIQNHLLMVLDAQGGLVWEQQVADNTASASGVAAQDLTGNGAWEILWNGAGDGLLILNGADGRRLFNEPWTGSGTVLDYPTLADVDGDGQAEIVVAGRNGLFVIGHSGRWADSRPLWNQHNYHINNIDNNWQVPFAQEGSWTLHNTYRTQTPDRDPACVNDAGVLRLPRIIGLSPAAGSVLPTGQPLVFGGRAIAAAAQQPVTELLVNGQPATVQDPSGSFFTEIVLDPGVNSIEIVARDRCTETVLALELNGAGDNDDPWTRLADATVLIEGRFAGTTHDLGNLRLLARVQADSNAASLPGPILMALGGDLDPSIALLNADGFTPQGEPYVIVVPEGEALSAGASSVERELALSNPRRASIDFTPRWIAPVNQVPYFTSLPTLQATVGQTWQYSVEVADGNGDTVALSLPGAPLGMSLQGNTLSWTPSVAGNFDVLLAASDGRGGSTQQGFTLRVGDGTFNSPPVFTTTPLVQVPIGAPYAYAARAFDLDGDTLMFSLQAAPAGVHVDAASGELAWSQAQGGQHSLVLQVDDGRGGQASQAWTLYVGEPAGSLPGPAFASVPVSFAAVGVQYRYVFRINSLQPDALIVSLLQAPAAMVLDPVAGVLSWLPGGADLGSHVIELQAVDSSGLAAIQRYELQVLQALPNQPPYFVSTPPLKARVAALYEYPAEAIDPEFENLSWSLLNAPAGMVIDPASGELTWTPDAAAIGSAEVSVLASDPHGGNATQDFFVQVRAQNSPPVISTSPPTEVLRGQFYSARILASDADGDPLRYRLLEGPSGMTLHPSIGWLHWTTGGATPGSYSVSLEVSDGWGGRDELSFAINLLSDDEAPQVAIRMLQVPACRNETVEVCVEASDNVGLSSVSLAIDGQPRTLDSARCHLWTPTLAGLFSATAQAFDPSGQSGAETTTLAVADCNDVQAPVVTLISPLPGSSHDAPVPIVVSIEDNTPAILSWEVTLRVAGSEQTQLLASGSGEVNAAAVAIFDPTTLQSGDYQIDVLASDGAQTGGIRMPINAGIGVKPGRVAFTEVDLRWQLGAFPLVIGRSYDSLDASSLGAGNGDFSPGWRLALSASVDDSAADPPPGTTGIGLLAAEPFNSQTRITVVKPNGERVGFRFDPRLKSFPAVFQYEVRYLPDPGVTDSLRAVAWPDVVFQLGAGFADFLIPYNPSVYELTTAEGVVYRISETDGLLEVRDPLGGVLTASDDGWQSSWGARVDYLRNPQGQISDIVLIDADMTTELGRLTYGYDAEGRLVGATDLTGGTRSYAYEDADLPNHVTALFDALGRPSARMVFDDKGRQIAHCPGAADPVTLVGCSVFAFDGADSSQTILDGRGFRSELFFNDRGLLVLRRDEVSDGVFAEQGWLYDLQGRVIEYTDADGGLTVTEWDENGNRISEVEPDGRTFSWEWGSCREPDAWLQQCDALANCTTQILDEGCRVEQRIDPLGGFTEFEYNLQGQRTGRIDPIGQRIDSQYDSRSRLSLFTDGLGAGVISEYGDFGELLAENERDGIRREWGFDSGRRVATETWLGAGVGQSGISWSHDNASFIDGLSWPGAELDVSYWPNGRVRRITHTSAQAPDWWIEYSYDSSDNVTRLEDSFGGITEYDYNGLNQLVEVRQHGVGMISKRVVIESSSAGQALKLSRYQSLDNSQPGPVTDFEYGCLSCPTTLSRIAHRRADTSLIHDLVIQRNALHQITELADVDGTHSYLYDGRGWLIQADHPPGFAAGNQSFQWDGAGNWLTRTGSFGGALTALLGYQQGQGGHRLLSDGANSYQYDARGALTGRSGPSGRVQIDRDGRGNPVAIIEFDAADQVISTASYLYSSNQQRVRAERDGTVRHYIFDGPNPIIALDAAGQVVWRQLHTRSTDRPLATEVNGQLVWLLTDHIGSVRNQVDNAGQVLASFSYDAFGRQLSGPAATLDDPVRYSGREFDLPGGLGYYRLRLYDPAIARFLEEDSLEPWHYRYVDNNPLSAVDPSGAVAATEYALKTCDAIGILNSGGEADAVALAFQGAINALLQQLADNLEGATKPCGGVP